MVDRMPLTDSQQKSLVAAALKVQKNAYSPYSGFLVGAAILTADGKTLIGCNVENASYGLAICAERSAVSSMVAAGCKTIVAIAISSQGGVPPCGACRQVLIEFGSDFDVILVDSDKKVSREEDAVVSTWKMGDLLPSAFRKDSLG